MDAPAEVVEEAMTQLRDRGFVNYFGMQRFGTMTVPTPDVGRALLRSAWQEAVDLLLRPHTNGPSMDAPPSCCVMALTGGGGGGGGDVPDTSGGAPVLARYAQDKDAAAALRDLPGRCTVERLLLTGLQRVGATNPYGAFQQVPRNLRLLYVHSFQSLVWNRLVTIRLRRFGIRPVAGDLVLAGTATAAAAAAAEAPVLDADVLDADDADAVIDADAATDAAAAVAGVRCAPQRPSYLNGRCTDLVRRPSAAPQEASGTVAAVEVLTEATAAQYTLADVVLPMPGFKIEYPPNLRSDVREPYDRRPTTTASIPADSHSRWMVGGRCSTTRCWPSTGSRTRCSSIACATLHSRAATVPSRAAPAISSGPSSSVGAVARGLAT